MKKILILNGSPRKNGKTASLVRAFTEGATAAGNEVRELYLQGMKIGGCLACEACSRNGGQCAQKDDMEKVNEAFIWADVVVLASPMYWGTITGQLKIVIDRLYAMAYRLGWDNYNREIGLLMTARGNFYEHSLAFYSIFTDIMHWKSWGTVLGAGKEAEARQMGLQVK